MKDINSLLPEELQVPQFASGFVTDPGDGDGTFASVPAVDSPLFKDPALPARGTRARGTRARLTPDQFLKKKTDEALTRLSSPLQGVLQLAFPAWDDDFRGLPNPLVRSGLFTASLTPKRRQIRDEPIASLSNYEVLYRGEELRQTDLSVWLAIVNQGRGRPLGEPIRFTGYRLIKDLKWRMHSESYQAIKDSIERLKFTSVKLSMLDKRAGYAGSLIRDYSFSDLDEKGSACWTVRLEESIAKLFLSDTTTLFEWDERNRINKRAALAQWLHTFYLTHSEPIPYHLSKLHELAKSDDKRLSNFRVRVRAALETLVSIGFLERYSLEKDLVHVVRARRSNRIQVDPLQK